MTFELAKKIQDLVLSGCIFGSDNNGNYLIFNRAEGAIDYLEQSYPINNDDDLIRIVNSHWKVIK